MSGKLYSTFSELRNESRNLREEINKLEEYVKDLGPLKDQVAKLEQALAWLTSKQVET